MGYRFLHCLTVISEGNTSRMFALSLTLVSITRTSPVEMFDVSFVHYLALATLIVLCGMMVCIIMDAGLLSS